MTDQARVEALRELVPFLRHTLGESPPLGGWPYDPCSPMQVNPRLRAALAAADAAHDQPCPTCSGTGELESSDSTDDRWWKCHSCAGTGAVQPSREDEPLDSLISPIWRHVHEARAERDAAEAERDALRTERDQLREAITEALHWHAYSLSRPDEDGNRVRIEKVEAILRAALDAREP